MSLHDLSTVQFEQAIISGGIILDVRTREEYAEKHIENSILIPVEELQQRIGELDSYKSSSILVYCKAGVRSYYAGVYLVEMGFTSVSHLQPGILGWAGSGKPVIRL